MSMFRVILLLALVLVASNAFAPCFLGTNRQVASVSSRSTSSSSSLSPSSPFSSPSPSALEMSSVVVVSPPGGVGEVAAVKAACLGSSVRWFVVSAAGGVGIGGDRSSTVALAPQTLRDIADASGSLELAGATVEELMAGGDALAAVSQWCGAGNDGLICTYDGAGDDGEYEAALRLAAKEAASGGGVRGPRVAILAAEKDLPPPGGSSSSSSSEGYGGLGRVVGSLFGSGPDVPPTLPDALSSGGGEDVCVVRHGKLFGLPESSPDFSPLVGGPRRDPVMTDEYTTRAVRVDPFVFSGNVMSSSSSRTCRHCVGEAAALFATGKLQILKQPLSLSSQAGTDEWTLEQWEQEMDRVQELVASGKASVLFSQEMIVDDTERLADWLATKWAPAVMRTYDIAAIRIGARPVYAARAGDGLVEITWQELIDFDSVMVGTMILQVTSDGISATRGAGNPSKGFGAVSERPLPGEDVLVRRLSEAAAQAVEKGLARKKPMKKATKLAAPPAVPVSTLQAAGNVEIEAMADASSKTATSTATAPPPPVLKPEPEAPPTGPRQAGARRSTPRSRGAKKTSSS